jgi:ElaB/YqjD/DUF883 family membrane-anchored ribosome-binding protein
MDTTWNPSAEKREGEKDVYEKAKEMAGEGYEKASEKVGEAYRKTSQAMSGAYESGAGYVRENPGMTTLIALGVGIGIGFLLASGVRRPHYGYSRFTEPIVDAIYDMVGNYIR